MKEIRSLIQKKYRDRLGEMLVEGIRGVASAFESGADVRMVLVTGDAADRVAFARAKKTPVHIISDADMASISAVETSQGVLAVVGIERLSVDDLVDMNRVVVLDGIQDPGNAGTIVRTAAWFGAEAIVTSSGTVDLYNPKAIRAAMGGLWDVRHVRTDALPVLIDMLRRAGFSAYGADMDGTPVGQWEPATRSVLVFGSEARGISPEVRNRLDDCVLIPGRSRRNGTESLNVAVAAGILIYEWMRNT